jgi:hypothetical protein
MTKKQQRARQHAETQQQLAQAGPLSNELQALAQLVSTITTSANKITNVLAFNTVVVIINVLIVLIGLKLAALPPVLAFTLLVILLLTQLVVVLVTIFKAPHINAASVEQKLTAIESQAAAIHSQTAATVRPPLQFEPRSISSLSGRRLSIGMFDVRDYPTAVMRLADSIKASQLQLDGHILPFDSLTAIGIYGKEDLLIEVIFPADKNDMYQAHILSALNLGLTNLSEAATLIDEPVLEVALFDGCPLDGVNPQAELRSVALDGGAFPNQVHGLNYKVCPVSAPGPGTDARVWAAPCILAYVFIERNEGRADQLVHQKQLLLTIYNALRSNVQSMQPCIVMGLYRLHNAVLLKTVVPNDAYYNIARFTKALDRFLRERGFIEHVQLRTVPGAEVLAWR